MQGRKLVSLLAFLAPLPLLGACAGDDTQVVAAAGGKAGNGAAGAKAGSGGLAGASTGGSTAAGSGGSSGGSAGSSTGGKAGSATGGAAGASAGAAGTPAAGAAGASAGGAAGATGGQSGAAGSTNGGAAGSTAAGAAGAAGSTSAGAAGASNGGAAGSPNGGSGGSAPIDSCGNGALDDDEECDDGNKVPNDGCTAACKLAKCGDGILDATEGCDDGNTNAGDSCSPSCVPTTCGNGTKDAAEACDDGNQVDTDACTNKCTLPVCGDGVVQTGEECDDANAIDTDACVSCKNATCGDGIVQDGVEQCDELNTSDTDGCTTKCKFAACGDGFVQAGEVCDDGNDVKGDGCHECVVDVCGNGIIDPGEDCDGANLGNSSCALASGNPKLTGTLKCSPNCFFDQTGCFETCASSSTEATLTKKPVDIIFVIDNSGSMSQEIAAVQNNINDSFASKIAASGIDYRVIMISAHGSSTSQRICVKAPLSGTTCSPIPAAPAETARFKQSNTSISSTNSLSRITSVYNTYSQHLRANAVKIFVEVTDDQSSISMAAFETALFNTGSQFGTAAKRNYIFHSIVGVVAKPGSPNAAYQPNEAMVGTRCSSAVNTGSVYQELSRATGGLRYPVCNTASYDAVFNQIATAIVDGSAIECTFPIPVQSPPVDRATLRVEYTPGTAGNPPKQTFGVVANLGACAAGKVYIEGDNVKLCPATCTNVQADSKAKLNVVWGCGGINE